MDTLNTKYKLDTIKVSQHAKERYSERIMDKDNKLDVNLFISQHETKIKEDIYKMIQYGTLIYSGRSVSEFNKQPVDIFLNDTWVIIVDIQKSNVITLYSIDLGLGREFNHEYICKLIDKLDKAKEKFEEINMEIQTQKENYSSIIQSNNEQIKDYKNLINNLEKQNQAYQDVIENLNANRLVAEKEVRDIIAIITGRKVF